MDVSRKPGPTLTIVVPALDEEAAIGDTLRRCLDAREFIIANSPVDAVEVILVSDGSTDRTEEIGKGFDEVTVLTFVENRGYGAAIKMGWEYGEGSLLSFLDGDGTCDPRFFANLCSALIEREADIALASRMGPESEMPWIRTLGNRIFAVLLGALSRRSVEDTASGMRVVRRECLDKFYPLPDGLHFTPSMSARVLIHDELDLIELPMAYAERTGESKLSVIKDGVRFLTTILRAAVTFRPARLLLSLAALFGFGAIALGAVPWWHWLSEGNLDESMIYRVMLSYLLATTSLIFASGAVVAERIAAKAHGRLPSQSGVTGAVTKLFSSRSRIVTMVTLASAAVVTVWPGIVEFATTGEVEMHWSRAMLASLLLVVAVVIAVTSLLLNMMDLIEADASDEILQPPPDRIRPARNGA